MSEFKHSELLSDWEFKPVRYIFSVLNGATPASGEPAYWDGDIYWSTPEDIGSLRGKVLTDTRRKITQDGYRNCGTQMAPIGSIVMTTRAPVGNLALAGVPMCTNQGCKTLVPRTREVDTRFFYYQFIARKEQLGIEATGTTFLELGSDDLRSFFLWSPPPLKQRVIADYLDRETARIDSLIAAKERLLELLAEKRRAVITHAVTHGLNSDVSVRDSGVEWLGQIPKHWEVSQIKYIAQVGNGSTPLRDNQDYWKNGQFPWLTSTVVNTDIVGEPIDYVTKVALKDCHLPIVQPNSVLIAITGEGKTRGKAAILRYQATINQHLAFIFPDTTMVTPEYIQAFLTSSYEILRMISDGSGSTKGALTCEQLNEYLILLPPLEEQYMIVDYLNRQTRNIDRLVTLTRNTVHLLHERRAALIAEVVSGQIQVGG